MKICCGSTIITSNTIVKKSEAWKKIYNHFNIYLTKSISFYFLVNTPPSQLKRKTRIVGGEKKGNNSEIYCQGLDSIDARTLLSQQSFVTPFASPFDSFVLHRKLWARRSTSRSNQLRDTFSNNAPASRINAFVCIFILPAGILMYLFFSFSPTKRGKS